MRISQAELAPAVAFASAVSRAGTHFVADRVRLSAAPFQGLKVSASDQETTFEVVLGGATLDEWEFADLPAKALDKLVASAYNDSPLVFTAKGKQITIAENGSISKLAVKDGCPDLAMPINPDNEQFSISVRPDALIHLLSTVPKAAGKFDANPVLGSVHFVYNSDQTLTIEATDGYRLHYGTIGADLGDAGFDCLMNVQTIPLLVKFLETWPSDEVVITASSNVIEFKTVHGYYTTIRIDGRGYDLTSIKNSNQNLQYTVDRTRLQTALRRALVMSAESNNTVTLTIDGDDIQVFGRSVERGDVLDDFKLSTTCGAAWEAQVNGKYLYDALLAVGAGDVTLSVSATSGEAVRLCQDNVTAIVMPVNRG